MREGNKEFASSVATISKSMSDIAGAFLQIANCFSGSQSAGQSSFASRSNNFNPSQFSSPIQASATNYSDQGETQFPNYSSRHYQTIRNSDTESREYATLIPFTNTGEGSEH